MSINVLLTRSNISVSNNLNSFMISYANLKTLQSIDFISCGYILIQNKRVNKISLIICDEKLDDMMMGINEINYKDFLNNNCKAKICVAIEIHPDWAIRQYEVNGRYNYLPKGATIAE